MFCEMHILRRKPSTERTCREHGHVALTSDGAAIGKCVPGAETLLPAAPKLQDSAMLKT